MIYEKGDLVDILSDEYKGIGIFLELDIVPISSASKNERYFRIFILDDQYVGTKKTVWFHPTSIRKHKSKE